MMIQYPTISTMARKYIQFPLQERPHRSFGGEELSVFVLWIRVAEIELLGVESLQFSANLQFC